MYKRITCQICGKRRKPWWRKYRGETIERFYTDNYLHTMVKVRPISIKICASCVEKRLKI